MREIPRKESLSNRARSACGMLALFVLALSSVGCGIEARDAPTNEERQFALGTPVDGFPSVLERQVLYLTNRSRTEPELFNADDPYPPSPPLRWDLDLSRAARFHAQHIEAEDCWCEDHSSCCELEAVGDDVQCSAPATGCGGTDAATRVAFFSPSYRGENMARGHTNAEAVVEGWTRSPGHWANMNAPSFRLLGVGYDSGAWVQDFGSGPNPPVAADGIHVTRGALTHFGITYYQPGSGGPQEILAVVGGACHPLDNTSGTPEHGAFEVGLPLEAGCHRYYFYVRDGNGNDFTYPSVGSLGVGVQADCPLFVDARPADTCTPAGQPCQTGDSRSCYTGPFGTRDVGLCESGVERCVRGQWTGECFGENHPTSEICSEFDEDCDGQVDEGCNETEDTPEPEPPIQEEDEEDGISDSPDETLETPASSGGCSSVSKSARSNHLIALLVAAMMAALVRLRRTKPKCVGVATK